MTSEDKVWVTKLALLDLTLDKIGEYYFVHGRGDRTSVLTAGLSLAAAATEAIHKLQLRGNQP